MCASGAVIYALTYFSCVLLLFSTLLLQLLHHLGRRLAGMPITGSIDYQFPWLHSPLAPSFVGLSLLSSLLQSGHGMTDVFGVSRASRNQGSSGVLLGTMDGAPSCRGLHQFLGACVDARQTSTCSLVFGGRVPTVICSWFGLDTSGVKRFGEPLSYFSVSWDCRWYWSDRPQPHRRGVVAGRLGAAQPLSGPSPPRADASLATCAMSPTGTKRAAEEAQVEAPTAAPETSSTAPASSIVALVPLVVATPKGKTLVQAVLEESTQQRRASDHRGAVDQVINKVIYDHFRSWNALQTDGVRVGGLALRERLLDDRKKGGISGGLRGSLSGSVVDWAHSAHDSKSRPQMLEPLSGFART